MIIAAILLFVGIVGLIDGRTKAQEEISAMLILAAPIWLVVSGAFQFS